MPREDKVTGELPSRAEERALRGVGNLRLGIALLLASGMFACFSGSAARVARQSWLEDRGPVVPHDSFPADCTLCHTGSDWSTIRGDFAYDHAVETGTELYGAHVEAECLRCHNDRGPVASFSARGCAGCHEDRHEGELGRDCTLCHGELTWRAEGAIADHSNTRFPLYAAHAAVACWRCHEGAAIGDFSNLSVECFVCHLDDLDRATDPDHLAAGWVQDCQRCHRPISWAASDFNHNFFALTGAHARLECTACHDSGSFSGLSTDCYDCHSDDYAGATSLDHVGLGLSTDCALCHSTRNWEDADFSHSGITAACVDCHLGDFQNTTDPDHTASGFSTDCESCHVTSTWSGASFNHTGISDGCVDCHLDDYQATSDPDHLAAGFPTDCEGCHNTQNWDDATFSHDFPINSGDHGNLDCVECHTIPGNFVAFACIECHEHRQDKMDDKHSDEDGYEYTTAACYSCHPDGDD